MALIKCPECGKEISDKAKACVFCGYPMPEVKLIVPDNELEQTPPVTDIQEQPNMAETPTKGQSATSKINGKQKKKITLVAAIVALAVIVIWGSITASNNAAKAKDLSGVFDFSFDMTMEDVIEYEAWKYGNTEYEHDHEHNRLDFEPYGDDWKHMYFFDEKTGLLKHVSYAGIMTLGDRSACEHVRPLKEKLLNVIGEWDEKSTSGSSRKVAYGQIDGEPCKILYYDYSKTEDISIFIRED